MKKNNLTTAIVAGLAGVAGLASVSNAAVSLNPDGIGQVLIFPYYTVNNGLTTLISVVNTTDQTKAVKVRFLEGKNSQEVLDFNLYLSPYDVWVAALNADLAIPGPFGIIDSSFSDYWGQDSVKITTPDTSCTVPTTIGGSQFLPYDFHGDAAGINNMSRATEGHFEMIEMGVVTAGSAYAAWIDHGNTGVPADCDAIQVLWFDQTVANGDIWNDDGPQGSTNVDATLDGFGGLFGSTYIVDVANGFAVSYNADAIQGYNGTRNHTDPGSVSPSIRNVSTGDGTGFRSVIFSGGSVVTTDWNNGPDAISALYMHDNIYNEYVLTNGTFLAETEWVITFPTKRFYVEPTHAIGVPPVDPFTTVMGIGGACEQIGLRNWNREEGEPGVVTVCPPGFVLYTDPLSGAQSCISPPSPEPPPCDPDVQTCEEEAPSLCWETNVVEFTNDPDQAGSDVPSGILGSTSKRGIYFESANTGSSQTNFSTGWVDMSFPIQSNTRGMTPGGIGQTYNGLPVTGFAIQKWDASGAGKLFGTIFKHRASRSITS